MPDVFGDHFGAETEWIDDRAAIVRCPRCGSDAYARTRANSGGGFPLHRHVVVACTRCNCWSTTCDPAPIGQPDMPVGVTQ